MKIMQRRHYLLCWHVFLCISVYGIPSSETTNIGEVKKADDIFPKTDETLLENEKPEISSEKNESISEAWNENLAQEPERTVKKGERFAESRRLLIDDGIQDDKKLQDIDSSKDDLTWRLKGTSFLQDLAREVLGVSYSNHDTVSELRENTKEEKNEYESSNDNPEGPTEKGNYKDDEQLEENQDNADFGSQEENNPEDDAAGSETIAEDYSDEKESDEYEYYDDDDYDGSGDMVHQSSDQEEFTSHDYEEDSIEDDSQVENNQCTQDGDCTLPNTTMSLREKLQQDLEASYSEPLPSRINYRLKRKPSIYSSRKPSTKSDIGPPDIYEKEVDVRVVPKDKYSSSAGDKTTDSEGVISDHRKFLPSTSQKFIPLGAIYRSALEGRENSEGEESSGETATNYKDAASQLSAPSGGLRKHLPFRRPFTFKAKRVHGESKTNDHYADDGKEDDDHSKGLSTLEKITLNKTPGVAIEYPPIFHPQIGESVKGRRKRPYRKRLGKKRRKNLRKPSLQSLSQQSSGYDLNSKTQNEPIVKEISSGYPQNPTKSVPESPTDEYFPPKVDEPHKQTEGYKNSIENAVYIKEDSSYSTTLSSIYVTPSSYLPPTQEIQPVDKPVANYVPPSTKYVALEQPTTPQYTASTTYKGSKSQVPGWLLNMQNNKYPTPPPGYVPETTTQIGAYKQKQDYKNLYETPSKIFVSSCNTCQGMAGEIKYITPAQNYELPQNKYLAPNKNINYNYSPPSKKPQLSINSFVPSQKYVPPKTEYVPPKQDYKIPSQSYDVPQKEYIPPNVNYRTPQNFNTPPQIYETPQNEYLPPSRSRLVDQKYSSPPVNSQAVSENYKPPSQSYEAPKNEYLPTTKSHEVVQNNKIPPQTYEVPKNEYLPPTKSNEVGQSYKVPLQSYEAPKNEYLPPTKTHEVAQNYKIPPQTYEVPKNEYLPPTKSYDVAQNYKAPSQSYEVPKNEYLPPTKSYDVAQNYKAPSQSYEVPKNEYLPPTNFYDVAQNYKVPPQTYEIPKNEYLPPTKSYDVAQNYKVPLQSYEAPQNEYFLQTVEKNLAPSYKIPSQKYETPVIEYLPPDSKTPISIQYVGISKEEKEGPKITTRRPAYNLRTISQTKELKTIGPSRIKQTQKRPSENFDDNYDIEMEYYVEDYDLPKSQIDHYSNYEYEDDVEDQFPTSKLNLRQHQMIDYNFDIKENDILEYGYIIGIPGIAGIDYPILKYIPLTTFRCHLVADYPGYYADMEAGCQVFHVCHPNGRQDSFLCPNGTIFNQKYFVCDWWYNFSCEDAAFFYAVNAAIGQPDESQSFTEVQLKPSHRSNGYNNKRGSNKRGSNKRGSNKNGASIYRHRKRSTIVDNSRKRPYRLRRRYSVMGAMSSPVYL